MKKNVLIIAGPSAVGKTTVATLMKDKDGRFEFVRSVTTRARRGDSFDDEYIYLTKEEFLDLKEKGGVLESTEYAGALYGTPRSEVDRITGEGRVPLLVLDMVGVRSVVEYGGDIHACGVYIYDDINKIEERLYKRFIGDDPTPEGMAKFVSRKNQNFRDYSAIVGFADSFYAFVDNSGTLADTVKRVTDVFADFEGGVLKNTELNYNTVRMLAASVEQKAE